jgi:hypothetical protein
MDLLFALKAVVLGKADRQTKEAYFQAAVRLNREDDDTLKQIATLAVNNGLELSQCGFNTISRRHADLQGQVNRQLKSCTAGQLVDRMNRILGGCRDTRSKEVCLTAAVKACKSDLERLSSLSVLAASHGVDGGRCGLTRALQHAAKRTAGMTGRGARRELRQLASQHRRGGSIERAFYRHHDGGRTTLRALGQLEPRKVERALRSPEDRRRLQEVTYQAMCNRVATGVQRKVRQAIKIARTLQGSKAARSHFVGRFSDERELAGALMRLGVEADVARRVAKDPRAHDGALEEAFGDAMKVLQDIDRFCNRAERRTEVALALFDGFKPEVDRLRKKLGIREGSFVDRAVRAGLDRGEKNKTFNKIVRIGCGIVSTIIVGTITGGVGGVAGAAAFSAASTAIQSTPGVVAALNEEQRAHIGEQMRLMKQGAGQAARDRATDTILDAGLSTAISALGGVFGHLVKGLGVMATAEEQALGPLHALARGVDTGTGAAVETANALRPEVRIRSRKR